MFSFFFDFLHFQHSPISRISPFSQHSRISLLYHPKTPFGDLQHAPLAVVLNAGGNGAHSLGGKSKKNKYNNKKETYSKNPDWNFRLFQKYFRQNRDRKNRSSALESRIRRCIQNSTRRTRRRRVGAFCPRARISCIVSSCWFSRRFGRPAFRESAPRISCFRFRRSRNRENCSQKTHPRRSRIRSSKKCRWFRCANWRNDAPMSNRECRPPKNKNWNFCLLFF